MERRVSSGKMKIAQQQSHVCMYTLHIQQQHKENNNIRGGSGGEGERNFTILNTSCLNKWKNIFALHDDYIQIANAEWEE